LKFQEDGTIWQLERKWFSYAKECDDNNEYIKDEGLVYLDLYNFGKIHRSNISLIAILHPYIPISGGVLLLVLVGLFVGLCIAIGESCRVSIQTARHKNVSKELYSTYR
jgi:hypothetical protein